MKHFIKLKIPFTLVSVHNLPIKLNSNFFIRKKTDNTLENKHVIVIPACKRPWTNKKSRKHNNNVSQLVKEEA
jgi:hypothetical protein